MHRPLIRLRSHPERDLWVPNRLRGQDSLSQTWHPVEDEKLSLVQLGETEFDSFQLKWGTLMPS